MPVEPTGPNPHVEMDVAVGVLVTFRNGLTALEMLENLGNWVRNVIEGFAPCFEGPQARRLWGLSRGGKMEEPVRMRITLH